MTDRPKEWTLFITPDETHFFVSSGLIDHIRDSTTSDSFSFVSISSHAESRLSKPLTERKVKEEKDFHKYVFLELVFFQIDYSWLL